MARMTTPRVASAAATAAMMFALGGCLGDGDKQAEIDRLNQELADVRADYEADRNQLEVVNKENDKLRDGSDKAEQKQRELERKLADAERALEVFRGREREAQAAKQREPSKVEKVAQAKDKATAALEAMVTVVGDRASGAGVLVESDGKTWVYVPASALSGNAKLEVKRANGERLAKFGAFEVSTDADMARLEVLEAPGTTVVLAKPAQLQSGVALLGVNDAAVLVEGNCYDAAATELQCDAELAKCSVGTPVFHAESGELLGLVTPPRLGERDLWGAVAAGGYDQSGQRSIGRLDRKMEWSAVPIAAFLEESKLIAEAERLAKLVQAFAMLDPKSQGMNLDANVGGSDTVRSIFKANATMTAVRDILELEKRLADKKMKTAETDVKKRSVSLFTQVVDASRRQAAAFEAKTFSPFNRPAAKQALDWLKAAEKRLAETVARIGDE